MAFGTTSSAGKSDIEFTATTGPAKTGIEELRATFSKATAGMSDDALKLQAAQERADNAIIRSHGRVTSSTLAAELNLRKVAAANEETAGSAETASVALRNEATELERVGRGAAVGTGLLHGLGRAAAFSSTAFIGGAGLVYAVREFVKASQEQQANEAQVAAALKAQGVNYGAYKGQIDDTLGSLERLSGFSEDDVVPAFTKLVRTTGDVESGLKRTALAAAIARGANIPLASATNIVNKALVNSLVGLRRLGIEIPKGATGYQALEIASRKFAGSLQANADTEAGAQERLTIAIHQTEVGIGKGLTPEIQTLETRLTNWLDDTNNQARIQRDVNQAVEDGTKIVHGLVDAEKLIAPPIHAAIGALGGLEHAVELALIVGLAVKAKRGAASLGLIQAGSARARTQIVADAAIEERALAGVAAQASRTSGVISRVGGAGGAVTGLATGAGVGGIVKRYGAKVGGPLALAALLGGSELGGGAGNNVTSAATYALIGSAFGPVGTVAGAAGYEVAQGGKALSNYLGTLGVPGLGNHPVDLNLLAQGAASGQLSLSKLDEIRRFAHLPDQVYNALKKIVTAATVYTVTPTAATGKGNLPSAAAGTGARVNYTNAAQERAANLLLRPNDVGLLRDQLAHDDSALAFLEKRKAAGKIGGQKYLDELQNLTNDRDQTQGRIDSILQAEAAKTTAARLKAEAAARKAAKDAEDAREATVRALIAGIGTVSGRGPGAGGTFLSAALRKYLPKTVSGSETVPGMISQAYTEQSLQNRLATAQLHQTQAGTNSSKAAKAIREEILAYQAIYAQQEKEAKHLTGVALLQKQGDEIATRQAIAQLQQQQKQASPVAAAAANEAQFLSSFASIVSSYAPNAFPSSVQLGGPTNAHLHNVVHETRQMHNTLKKIYGATRFPGSRAAQVAVEAAFG